MMASTTDESSTKIPGTAAIISVPPAGEEARIALNSAGGVPTIGTGGGGGGSAGTTSATASMLDKNTNTPKTPGPPPPPALVLRHGSSLSLIATVCSFLADPDRPDNFSYVDPNGDQGKWRRRGMDLYYCAVTDPATGAVLCAARCATQGLMVRGDGPKNATMTTTKKRRRILIDYLYTIESARDMGIARQVVLLVLRMAREAGAYCYVLSLEDSAVYWMEKWGFYLCEDGGLNAKLNVFPDTHLLRLGSDPKDEVLPEESEDQRRLLREGTENSTPNGQVAASGTCRSGGNGTARGDNGSSSSNINNSSHSGRGDAAPSDAFVSALTKLLAQDPPGMPRRSDELRLCLTSLSLLLRNAMAEEPGGRRRRVRIANPSVRERVFSVGGDHAMALLQCSGFELGVDEEGDATLTFHNGAKWLKAAVELLEKEATG